MAIYPLTLTRALTLTLTLSPHQVVIYSLLAVQKVMINDKVRLGLRIRLSVTLALILAVTLTLTQPALALKCTGTTS